MHSELQIPFACLNNYLSDSNLIPKVLDALNKKLSFNGAVKKRLNEKVIEPNADYMKYLKYEFANKD